MSPAKLDPMEPTRQSHETFMFAAPTGHRGRWYAWRCDTCGEMVDTTTSRSKNAVLLAMYRHRHNHHAETPHDLTFALDEYDALRWACSCGWKSHAFHGSERRAKQSHSQHTSAALLAEHAALDAHASRLALRVREEQDLVKRLRPAQLEVYMERNMRDLIG